MPLLIQQIQTFIIASLDSDIMACLIQKIAYFLKQLRSNEGFAIDEKKMNRRSFSKMSWLYLST